MNCPYCGSRLSKRNRCDRCGEDVTQFKRLYATANRLYNIGLAKAKVRDLSGAIEALSSCLKLDKKNIDARNLLGLIYLEMGETVLALSQWVISKHFQSEDNIAEYYMNKIQENPTKLDSLNQIIKKYNGALASAKSGSDDLAIIQLKKVVSMNPHYVQALQLLALLYIHQGDYDRAGKCLKKAARIDVANSTTLKYMDIIRTELGQNGTVIGDEPIDNVRSRDSIADRDVITPIQSYKEDKPNVMAWVNLVIGVIIGAAFIMVAIMPNIRRSAVQANSEEIVALNEKVQKLEADLSAADTEKASLEQDIEELRYQISNAEVKTEIVETDMTNYELLMQAAAYYIMDNKDKSAEKLIEADKDAMQLPMAETLYNKLSGALFFEKSAEEYKEGHALYTDGKFEESLKSFENALLHNPDNVDALYFSGRAYHRLEKYDKAIEFYNKLVNEYPDTGRAGEARDRLSELKIAGIDISGN